MSATSSSRPCPKCGKTIHAEATQCMHCWAKVESIHASKSKDTADRINRIILTTAPSIDGYSVAKTLDVISAECVYGLFFSDFFTSVTDIFGGRSSSTQEALREARKTCLQELRKEAAELDANAVIAIDLDYSEFSGKGKSMLFLVASGTAVRIVPSGLPSSLLSNEKGNLDGIDATDFAGSEEKNSKSPPMA